MRGKRKFHPQSSLASQYNTSNFKTHPPLYTQAGDTQTHHYHLETQREMYCTKLLRARRREAQGNMAPPREASPTTVIP